MENQGKLFAISQIDVINIFKETFNIELLSLSPTELDCFIEKAQTTKSLGRCDIGGDMDCDIPVDISQINEWLEFVTNIVEFASAYMLYSISKSSETKPSKTINESSEDEFYEYVIKAHCEKESIKGQRNKRRIKTIYKRYKEIVSRRAKSN